MFSSKECDYSKLAASPRLGARVLLLRFFSVVLLLSVVATQILTSRTTVYSAIPLLLSISCSLLQLVFIASHAEKDSDVVMSKRMQFFGFCLPDFCLCVLLFTNGILSYLDGTNVNTLVETLLSSAITLSGLLHGLFFLRSAIAFTSSPRNSCSRYEHLPSDCEALCYEHSDVALVGDSEIKLDDSKESKISGLAIYG
ncbi:MAG: hypothetical protein M1829_004136 [Trizodia sp. TS-e1964]|nr:MAG: hypothetical protein M1829_004136 [Trizodia sp. TS-e1964]